MRLLHITTLMRCTRCRLFGRRHNAADALTPCIILFLEVVMKKFEILGTGCSKCTTLQHLTEQAAKELGIPYQLNKVTDIKQIMSYGVMITPALVVDGQVKIAGKVPSIEEIKKLIQ